jgi:hypothetical protein
MSEIDFSRIDAQAVRDSLLLLIDSVASGGTTKTFGKTTPYMDYLVELLSMWFDDLYHGSQALVEDGIFSPEEAEVLREFSAAFEKAYPGRLNPPVVDINKLQNDPIWQSVVRAAREAQAKLRRLDS